MSPQPLRSPLLPLSPMVPNGIPYFRFPESLPNSWRAHVRAHLVLLIFAADGAGAGGGGWSQLHGVNDDGGPTRR